jgi:hypothetical protein
MRPARTHHAANLRRGVEHAAVIPVPENPSARAHQAIHAARDPHPEPFHGAHQARGIVSLDQQVDVISL